MARKPQKKQKTSIRTAAGTAQRSFSERLKALRADPLRVLPDCPNGEPKAIAKIHAGLDKIVTGKVGFLLKRDKGIVGAVLSSIELADQEAFPRLIDHKVGGTRRFFIQRGHVPRSCLLGVQNHDDARTLLMAYRPLAKSDKLHFFADPGITCTGTDAQPPQAWIDALANRAGFKLETTAEGWTCGHEDKGQVRLGFGDLRGIHICGACGKKTGNLHSLIRTCYAGPKERQPVEVSVVVEGVEGAAHPDKIAAYRGGVIDEKALVDSVTLT